MANGLSSGQLFSHAELECLMSDQLAGVPASEAPSSSVHTPLVVQRDRHLKSTALDWLEGTLMILCGVALLGFVTTVFFDITTRTLGRPWLWLQEVTSAFFIYGVFIGTAVAVRRNDHLLLTALTEAMTGRVRLAFETMNRVVVLLCGIAMVYYGSLNFLTGFGSFRMPSLTPIAYWYLAIPLSGIFIALFTIEQLYNGWKNGFEPPVEISPSGEASRRTAVT
jgi:TRAP-type C4-dicarboxylate transport system permease small subunit